MYTNRKRSENDQYNETSNHRQMKGYGGSGGSPWPRGSQALPLPTSPFIRIWFDASLYWSFSLRFPFVYILFYASNVYSTYISCYICIFWFVLFLSILFIFHVLYLFPRYTFWYQGPLLLIVYYPYKWNIAKWIYGWIYVWIFGLNYIFCKHHLSDVNR